MLNNETEKELDFNSKDLEGLGLEVVEISSSTMLEELGASFGKNSCSNIVILPTN